MGRWLNVDPLAGKYPSISPYVYGANNPINLLDPDGMKIINRNDSLASEMSSEMNNGDKDYYQSLDDSNEEFEFMDVYNGYQIIKEARKYITNLPYVRSAASLIEGADCSGFVWAILRAKDIKVPNIKYTTEVAFSEETIMGLGSPVQSVDPNNGQTPIWGDVYVWRFKNDEGRMEGHMGFIDPVPIKMAPDGRGNFFDKGYLLSVRSGYGNVHYGRLSWFGNGTIPKHYRPR
jgi:cell wall-associated NlpC family hydrolase